MGSSGVGAYRQSVEHEVTVGGKSGFFNADDGLSDFNGDGFGAFGTDAKPRDALLDFLGKMGAPWWVWLRDVEKREREFAGSFLWRWGRIQWEQISRRVEERCSEVNCRIF